MSVIDAADNSMKCVQIDVVKTNLDNFAAPVESPQQCKISSPDGTVVSDFESACAYYYKDSNGDE